MSLAFLVVEDHPVSGKTLQRALSRHGRAELVETRADAFARIANGGIDGVVTDVGLPDGSGFDVVREVRRVAPRTPVLVVSGDVDPARLREAHQNDVLYLLKPTHLSDLDTFVVRVRESAAKADARVAALVEQWSIEYDLSAAETAILRLGTQGTTARSALAAKRGVSPSTVKKQVQKLLAKSGDDTLPACVTRLLREVLQSL